MKVSNAVSTPGTSHTDDQGERRKGEAQLSRTMTTVFRSCVMRASSLSQDRADFAEAVMSSPSTSSMEDVEILGRHLLGRPTLALRYKPQRMLANIRVSVDSDLAAGRATQINTWY